MSFDAIWETIQAELAGLDEAATFVTPRTEDRFQVVEVQEPRIVVQLEGEADTQPLQRQQFETIYERLSEDADGFDLGTLPPDADPYPVVLSLHPDFAIDEAATELVRTAGATSNQRVDEK
jgi:hypothetical protein